MEKIGSIEIRITGFNGGQELRPANYDIREVSAMLETAEKMLFPDQKNKRPLVSYALEEGSVNHVFKTSMQFVIGFNALLGQISEDKSIDFLESDSAKALEQIQQIAAKKAYSFGIRTSLENSNVLIIDKSTAYYRAEALWVDAEFYLYGKVTNAGGKEKGSIRLLTEEYGLVSIQTPIKFLEQYEENILYKTFGIRAAGKQHSETGEMDASGLRFVELLDYRPAYDEQYLNSLIGKASKTWAGVKDKDSWLREVRGGYDF